MNEKKTKCENKAHLIMNAYRTAASAVTIKSVGYGQPEIVLEIGLYDLLISADTFLNKFGNVVFMMYPKTHIKPNPQVVINWMQNIKMTDITTKFISPTIYQIDAIYQEVPVTFNVILA